MKKIIAIFILVSLAAAFGCKKKQEEPRLAFLNFMNGEVFIVDALSKSRTAAKVGDQLSQGSIVETGAKSFADIMFGTNAIKLLENASFEVKLLTLDLATGAENSQFFIQNGKAVSRIAQKLGKNDSFKISTPTSIAAVRGTDFLIDEEDGKSYIACSDGKVSVERVSDKSTVEIDAGQEVYVEPGKPLEVKSLSETNKDNINRILEDIKDMREEIRRRFEEERDRMREEVRTQKEANKEMVQKQRDEDKQRVEDQKASDKANVEAIKGSVKAQDFKPNTDELKPNIDSVKPDIKGIKPEIKKPALQ
ncbi:MAG: FecR domain-containing protein [Leptospirales bacterium]|nr:FecR domain-containing protein [Leptospirales bacterium]